jgi:hypothetical protein
MPGPQRPDPVFLETPRGLITPAGAWFHTTRAQLAEHYAKVLSQTELDELVHRAEVWLQSHRSLVVWLLPLMLLTLPVAWAVAVAVVVFFVWILLAPSLGNRTLSRLFEWLGWAPLQVLYYVVILSYFGSSGQYERLMAGLLWFVAMRWMLLDYLSRPFTRKLATTLYALPIADQTLRAVIISEAIRLGVSLEGFPSIARWLDDSGVA